MEGTKVITNDKKQATSNNLVKKYLKKKVEGPINRVASKVHFWGSSTTASGQTTTTANKQSTNNQNNLQKIIRVSFFFFFFFCINTCLLYRF